MMPRTLGLRTFRSPLSQETTAGMGTCTRVSALGQAKRVKIASKIQTTTLETLATPDHAWAGGACAGVGRRLAAVDDLSAEAQNRARDGGLQRVGIKPTLVVEADDVVRADGLGILQLLVGTSPPMVRAVTLPPAASLWRRAASRRTRRRGS